MLMQFADFNSPSASASKAAGSGRNCNGESFEIFEDGCDLLSRLLILLLLLLLALELELELASC